MWFQKKTINVCIAWLMITAVFTIFWSEVVIAEEVQTAPSTTAVALASPSAILMEASTGTVLFEKNPDEIRSPASITKIMTLILTFEAIEKGRIKLEDEVSTSAYAKSMGGSQVD